MEANWREKCDSFISNYINEYGDLYKSLSASVKKIIKDYYRYRTLEVFNKEYPNFKFTFRLAAKTEKLAMLAKDTDDWKFGGIVDLGSVSGKCSLGHNLRYEYYAYSEKLKKQIVFGSKCASDFFDVPRYIMSRLINLQNEISEEIKEILYIYYNDYYKSYKAKYYNDFPVPFMADKNVADKVEKILGEDLVNIVADFLRHGIPFTRYLINTVKSAEVQAEKKIELEEAEKKSKEEVEIKYKNTIEECKNTIYSNSVDTVKAIIGRDDDTLCYSQKSIKKLIFLIFSEYVQVTEREFGIYTGTFKFLDNNRDEILKRIKEVFSSSDAMKYTRIFAKKLTTGYGVELDDKGYPIPTYINENGVQEYEFKYRHKIYEGLCALSYMYMGGIQYLRGFYWQSRNKNFVYVQDTQNVELEKEIILSAIVKVKSVFEMLQADDYLDKYKEEEIAQQMFVEQAIQINKSRRDGEEIAQEPFESIYNKMVNNIDKISDNNIVSMLKKFKYENLSDKQKDYICNVYLRIKDTISPDINNVFNCRSTGLEVNKVTKLFAIIDTVSNRKIALIMLRENNKPAVGYKVMISDFNKIRTTISELENDAVTPMIITNIPKFFETYGSDRNNFEVIDALSCGININDDKYKTDEITSSDEKLARKYFPYEGVIDKFIVKVSKCIEDKTEQNNK